MSKMFELVKEMNLAFGNPEGRPKDFDVNTPLEGASLSTGQAWSRLTKQCLNIKSEYTELMGAVEERNFDEVRDALCDIMVLTLGAYHFIGCDADEDMQEVISAVMTRFCKNTQQLNDTIKHFVDMGLVFTINGELPRVYLKSAKDQGLDADTGAYEYPRGKFLKSVGYRKPVFSTPKVEEPTPRLL